MRNVSSGSSSMRSSSPSWRSSRSVAPSRTAQARRPAHVARRCRRDARSWSSSPHVGSPAPMTSSTAWLPTMRSPFARSKQRKCVQQSSQLIGAQRKKICGSVRVGRGAGAAADRAHAPRPVLGAVQIAASVDVSPPVVMRPDHVPHCVRRVESIISLVPSIIVWRGSSSATVRAVNVTSASMPRSAASARTRVTRSGSTMSIVQRPDSRLRAVRGDAARREHRALHAVVHVDERARR